MIDEQYQTYLCSREWGLKREAVHARAHGFCERCKVHIGHAVHHKTYARKYHERLTDLELLCKGCHDFTHGRSDIDPALVQLRVYLAGAVFDVDECWEGEGSCEMIAPWRGEIFDTNEDRVIQTDYHDDDTQGETVEHGNLIFIYSGPAIEGCHGSYSGGDLPSRCIDQVIRSDLLFVWIDRDDTIGTLVEVGAAWADKKFIFAAFANVELSDKFYFVRDLASRWLVTESVKKAWDKFVWEIEGCRRTGDYTEGGKRRIANCSRHTAHRLPHIQPRLKE